MVSNLRKQDGQNCGDNVFAGISAGPDEAGLFTQFLDAHDFSANTRRAFRQDIRKFAKWFNEANHEPFVVGRVTTRDVADFRNHLRRDQGQAVATVNRALVTLRRFFGWLADQGYIPANPVRAVKELKRQQLAPKGLERQVVRRHRRRPTGRRTAFRLLHRRRRSGRERGDRRRRSVPLLVRRRRRTRRPGGRLRPPDADAAGRERQAVALRRRHGDAAAGPSPAPLRQPEGGPLKPCLLPSTWHRCPWRCC